MLSDGPDVSMENKNASAVANGRFAYVNILSDVTSHQYYDRYSQI